jgi:hypothetical protein
MILMLLWLGALIVSVALFTQEIWIWRFLFWLELQTMRLEALDEDAEQG